MWKFETLTELQRHVKYKLKKLKTSNRKLASQEIYDNFDVIDLIETILGEELDIEYV